MVFQPCTTIFWYYSPFPLSTEGKRNTGGRVQALVLFRNLLACWKGSKTAVYFGISTPDPSVLLNAAIGVLPDNVEEV